MNEYQERLERITEKYALQTKPLHKQLNELHIQRDAELDACAAEWARENGYPRGAQVEVDFEGYFAWHKGKGYTGQPLIKPDDKLRVSSVNRNGLVRVRVDQPPIPRHAYIPAQFVTLIDHD